MHLISIYNYNVILLNLLIYSSVYSICYDQGKKKVIVPCSLHEDEVRIILIIKKKIAFHQVTKCNYCTSAFKSNIIIFASSYDTYFHLKMKSLVDKNIFIILLAFLKN